MSKINPLVSALAREEAKVIRQTDLRDSTIAEMEVLGETAKGMNRLERQNQAIRDTKANITKLKAAVKALEKK
jgi:K+/H+ antiporter YhaU regulatory subunit KhtT